MNEFSRRPDDFKPTSAPVLIGESSLADVMAATDGDATIPEWKRRHWLTSMRKIAEAIGRPPESLPCRMTALRHPVNRLNAAALGWELKTLANHKANLRAAINHFMKVKDVPARGAPLASAWLQLMNAIPAVKPRRLLSGIARYCSARGIPPEAVTEAVVADYFVFRDHTGFLPCGPAPTRELMRAWNYCMERVPGWPQRQLILPNLPQTSKGPDWAEFPEGLRVHVERYLTELAKHHRTSGGRRRRGCKTSTLDTRRREIIAFARTAVAAGTPVELLTSLQALLAPDVVMPAFEAYLDRNGERPKNYTIDLSWKLLSVAKFIDAPADTIAHLDDIRARLEEDRGPVLTEKNLKVIRAVTMTDMWSRVIELPEKLMAEAQRMLNRSPAKAATLAALAVQIQILTRAPLRVGNLLSIRLGNNLTRTGDSDSNYRLCFPNYDVKNRVDLDFPLSARTTAMIDRFIHEFRPHLGEGHRGDWLFPGENGKHRSSSHASESIAKRVEREVGLRVTAHQFRHAAVAMILKAKPGDYEFARRILGHINIETTIRFYSSLASFKASEVFGVMVEESMIDPKGDNGKSKHPNTSKDRTHASKKLHQIPSL